MNSEENTRNRAAIITFLGVLAFLISAVVLILWVWFALPVHVNTSGNSTIGLNEISAQLVPTIINGIATSTNIMIAFGGALGGILIGYLLKDEVWEREFVITVLLAFLFPLLFEFFAYIFLAIGQGAFAMAIKFAFTSFIYSIFFLTCLFVFATYRMYERRVKAESERAKSNESKTG